jgi:hypothetical protein
LLNSRRQQWYSQRGGLFKPLLFPENHSIGFSRVTNFPVEPIGAEAVVGRLGCIACYEAAGNELTRSEPDKKRAFPMSNLPPAPDARLIALILTALIAVLTLASVVESPAAASTLVSVASSSSVSIQEERFQSPQEWALPPFGARTVLAPVESPRSQPQSAEAAR